MFSLFDAILQDRLGCADGFEGARKCLEEAGEQQLLQRFLQFRLAMNVLKHGRGRSYDALLNQIDTLPFRIKKLNESFFFEGDVGEISTLIEVNGRFVLGCVEVIRDVSIAITLRQPGVVL